jgi:membrane-associated HD superfamily phosphohydrolase
MLAWIDYSIPKLFNAKSVVLLLVLSFLAYLVSPRSPLDKKERDRLVLVYPLLIFVYVLLFQVFLLSLNPHVHYYLGPTGVFTWRMNTGICCAFGVAFSLRILRTPGLGWRFYGGFFLLIFLLLAFGSMMPPVMRT